VKATHLPPGCGADLDKPLLHNPYQMAFQDARRLRFCLKCQKQGSMDHNGVFVCSQCKTNHVTNLTAPRVFDRFLLLAGRGGGKTLVGAHAAREEILIPNSIGWVLGPTYKILHDSTFPTLVRLIPPSWVKKWDAEHMEITFHNGAMVAFRSLEDPERARGPHGVSWGWFDEAAQSPERAYDVFEPTLIAAGGIAICTTTVLGFDWTYDKIEKRALVYQEPGYWTTRWWTEENPLFRTNPVMAAQIERAQKTMAPEFYAQEYKAERRNATGLVYNYQTIEKQTLLTDDEVRKVLPEWPSISPSRQILVGLDSGADHPFGALMLVVTEFGIVAIAEYLKRMQAISQQLPAIQTEFGLRHMSNIRWAANKNEANLRLEFGLLGVGVIPAENKHEIGIQRVASWLHTGQLYFAYTVPKTIEQMRSYRYANNQQPDGQKKKEAVFKVADELPDALRYALMSWPHLPAMTETVLTDAQKARMAAFDDKTRADLAFVKQFEQRQTNEHLEETDANYPLGDFFHANDTTVESWMF
jgi:hypothetical protein